MESATHDVDGHSFSMHKVIMVDRSQRHASNMHRVARSRLQDAIQMASRAPSATISACASVRLRACLRVRRRSSPWSDSMTTSTVAMRASVSGSWPCRPWHCSSVTGWRRRQFLFSECFATPQHGEEFGQRQSQWSRLYGVHAIDCWHAFGFCGGEIRWRVARPGHDVLCATDHRMT